MYIIDLGSTSGTFLNGQQLLPRQYYSLLVGDSVVFANSPPFVVCGPKGSYEQQQQLHEQHSTPRGLAASAPTPATETPPASAAAAASHSSLAEMDEDKIDALVHAKVNAALMRGIAALDDQLARNVILEDEYYKRKCLLQDKIAKKQAELVQTLLKKKKEARIKQSLEDKASHQRAQQAAMKEERARAAAAAASAPAPGPAAALALAPASAPASAPSDSQATVAATSGSAPALLAPATAQRSPSQAQGVGLDLDAAFATVQKKAKQNYSSMATVKLDPKSEAFDVTAYKAMMVQKYELEQQQNSLLLKIRACGDPTSKHFDPVLYKRLMVEKYEKDQQIAANKRKIMHAELLAGKN